MEKRMVKLKSTFGKLERKRKKKRKSHKPIKDIVTGGVGALIGIAFVSQTADVISGL